MSSKLIGTVVVTAILALSGIGAYWHWSPFLAMKAMKTAAQETDAETFNQYVDYPRLRESLKAQMRAQMANLVGNQPADNTDMERAGAAFGAALGLAFVDNIVDALLTPETIMAAMNEAKLQSLDLDSNSVGSKSEEIDAAATGEEGGEIRWTFERNGFDRIVAYGSKAGETGEASVGESGSGSEEKVGLVFERSGFAQWKLVDVKLPESK